MMIDASAILGILNSEAGAPRLAAAIDAAKAPFTSPIAVYEATVALMQENQWTAEEAGGVMHEFLDAASIKVVMITGTIATSATKAFEKFGEGRHPANLNLNDCFAYVAARAYHAPLLFKGDDFSRADVKTVEI